jgi:hypothetical protein
VRVAAGEIDGEGRGQLIVHHTRRDA